MKSKTFFRTETGSLILKMPDKFLEDFISEYGNQLMNCIYNLPDKYDSFFTDFVNDNKQKLFNYILEESTIETLITALRNENIKGIVNISQYIKKNSVDLNHLIEIIEEYACDDSRDWIIGKFIIAFALIQDIDFYNCVMDYYRERNRKIYNCCFYYYDRYKKICRWRNIFEERNYESGETEERNYEFGKTEEETEGETDSNDDSGEIDSDESLAVNIPLQKIKAPSQEFLRHINFERLYNYFSSEKKPKDIFSRHKQTFTEDICVYEKNYMPDDEYYRYTYDYGNKDSYCFQCEVDYETDTDLRPDSDLFRGHGEEVLYDNVFFSFSIESADYYISCLKTRVKETDPKILVEKFLSGTLDNKVSIGIILLLLFLHDDDDFMRQLCREYPRIFMIDEGVLVNEFYGY
jgi:hypothetical protein